MQKLKVGDRVRMTKAWKRSLSKGWGGIHPHVKRFDNAIGTVVRDLGKVYRDDDALTGYLEVDWTGENIAVYAVLSSNLEKVHR